MEVRARLNQIARRQHGLITREQALRAGLSPGQVRALVRGGHWLVVRERVYAVAGAPASWTQTVCATALTCQPHAWVCHQTAGGLWAFRGTVPEGIDVLTGLDRRVRLEGVCHHRSGALFTDDLTQRSGIPLTTAERTLVDLSAAVPRDTLGRLLDDGLRRRIVRLDRLRRCVARLEGGPGRRPAAVHALLAERLPGYDPGDSDLETHVLRVLVAAGLPVPVQQYRIRLNGRVMRIDLAYPDLRLAIELEGWEFHGSRSAFDDDRARANELVLVGWTVVRFTSRSTDAEIVRCVRGARNQAA